jgi:hypothetical protein
VTHPCTVLTPFTHNLVRGGVSVELYCCKAYLVDLEFEVLIFAVGGQVIFYWEFDILVCG